MSFLKDNRRGIIGTTLFHTVLFLLLYFLGFSTPLPLPEEEGILVNFGNSNTGLGAQEPAPRKSARKKSMPKPKPVPPKQQLAQATPAESVAKEKVLTQNHEEAPAVPSAEEIARKKREKEEAEKRRREQRELDRQKQIEAEKRRQEELQRQREEEAERQRLAEIERQRKAEEERQKKIADINSKAKNVFGKGKSNSQSQSQGKTYTGGNQGNPNGSANSNNYSGNGLGDSGDYNLAGRNALSIPKPEYNYQEGGKVVVEVTVDRTGKVVSARPGMSGSTTSNAQLFAAAKKAALKAVFNADTKAAAYQKGTITYHFLLD